MPAAGGTAGAEEADVEGAGVDGSGAFETSPDVDGGALGALLILSALTSELKRARQAGVCLPPSNLHARQDGVAPNFKILSRVI